MRAAHGIHVQRLVRTLADRLADHELRKTVACVLIAFLCVYLSLSMYPLWFVQIRQLNVAMAELDTIKPKKVCLLATPGFFDWRQTVLDA